MRRIEHHPVLGTLTADPVRIWVDGEPVEALASDSVAAALIASGRLRLRFSRSGQPRGVYCGIGHCFECRVSVNSEPDVRACLRPVESGMCVETEAAQQ